MNLRMFSIFFISVCIVTSGCESQKIIDTSSDYKEIKESPYQVESLTYQDGNITIQYPQLTQMEDHNKQQKINNTIKKEAILFVNQYNAPDTTLNMDYQMMVNSSESLSILYSGDLSVTGGLYPSHLVFTTNMNVGTGEKLRALDQYVIDELFIDKLKNSSYLDWENSDSPNVEKKKAVIEYLNSISTNELIGALIHGDRPTIQENLYGVYTYFKDDSLIISIQVPHALGDHAEFRLKLDELK